MTLVSRSCNRPNRFVTFYLLTFVLGSGTAKGMERKTFHQNMRLAAQAAHSKNVEQAADEVLNSHKFGLGAWKKRLFPNLTSTHFFPSPMNTRDGSDETRDDADNDTGGDNHVNRNTKKKKKRKETEYPSSYPSQFPSDLPSMTPQSPSLLTALPSNLPVSAPSEFPASTPLPSNVPTPQPSHSHLPFPEPITLPSHVPTSEPSQTRSPFPSQDSTVVPSTSSSTLPTQNPTSDIKPQTHSPSFSPVKLPTVLPSQVPTFSPTTVSEQPSAAPVDYPSPSPSEITNGSPSLRPTALPSKSATVVWPELPLEPETLSPSGAPSKSSPAPSVSPVINTQVLSTPTPSVPSEVPSKSSPAPSVSPVISPQVLRTRTPSVHPSSENPSTTPSKSPSTTPTKSPSTTLSESPSTTPSVDPTHVAMDPTSAPTTFPEAARSSPPSPTATTAPNPSDSDQVQIACQGTDRDIGVLNSLTIIRFMYELETGPSTSIEESVAIMDVAIAKSVAMNFLECDSGSGRRRMISSNETSSKLKAVDPLPTDTASTSETCIPQDDVDTCTVIEGGFTVFTDEGKVNVTDILTFVRDTIDGGIFDFPRDGMSVAFRVLPPSSTADSSDSDPAPNAAQDPSGWDHNIPRTSYAMAIASAFVGSAFLVLVAVKMRSSASRRGSGHDCDHEAWSSHPSVQPTNQPGHADEQVLGEGSLLHSMIGGKSFTSKSFEGSIVNDSDNSLESMSYMGGSSVLGLRSTPSYSFESRYGFSDGDSTVQSTTTPAFSPDRLGVSSFGHARSASNGSASHVKWLQDWIPGDSDPGHNGRYT